MDGSGNPTMVTQSTYDSSKKTVVFSTNHFSTYGVGYKADAPVFTDTANHWAKDNMAFVAARGLLTGTRNTTLSPDLAMTQGMFITALGRLAEVDTNSYKTSSFTDVKADAYYAPYTNWAASKGITSGTTAATTFAPDQAVARQEMAVFMSNYAKVMGYTLPNSCLVIDPSNGTIHHFGLGGICTKSDATWPETKKYTMELKQSLE